MDVLDQMFNDVAAARTVLEGVRDSVHERWDHLEKFTDENGVEYVFVGFDVRGGLMVETDDDTYGSLVGFRIY